MEIVQTIEDLEEELDKTIEEMDKIAAEVAEGRLDAYEGFTQTESHKDKILELGHKLKDLGVDIGNRG
ncbi:hypothetical protein N9A28_06895 [Sulfurimonas sp.]|nr:hypothetical protein [Sulfurimonas sp.]